jgi:hypothetical protein
MKRKTVLLQKLGLIVLLVGSIIVPGIQAVTGCEYDCMTEETCLVNPYTLGCKQTFGEWVLDYEHGVYICVEKCSNPCSTNCFK